MARRCDYDDGSASSLADKSDQQGYRFKKSRPKRCPWVGSRGWERDAFQVWALLVPRTALYCNPIATQQAGTGRDETPSVTPKTALFLDSLVQDGTGWDETSQV
jgi:hypothetical protein